MDKGHTIGILRAMAGYFRKNALGKKFIWIYMLGK